VLVGTGRVVMQSVVGRFQAVPRLSFVDTRHKYNLPLSALGKGSAQDRRARSNCLASRIGGELKDLEHTTFRISMPWKSSAYSPLRDRSRGVEGEGRSKNLRYAPCAISSVHLHRLFDPGQDAKPALGKNYYLLRMCLRSSWVKKSALWFSLASEFLRLSG